MPEQETAKVQPRQKTPTGKVPATGIGKLLDTLKNNPAVILAVSSAVGLSGTELVRVLQSDLPGWALGLVVVAGWAISRVNDHLAQHKRMVTVVEQIGADMQDVKDQLAKGADQFVAVDGRLALIDAELAAHRDAIKMLAESRLERN